MYEEDLALNNLQGPICHKTQPKQIKYLLKTSILRADKFDLCQIDFFK